MLLLLYVELLLITLAVKQCHKEHPSENKKTGKHEGIHVDIRCVVFVCMYVYIYNNESD